MNAARFAAHSASLFAALFKRPDPGDGAVVGGGFCGGPRHPRVRSIAASLARMPDARHDAPRTPPVMRSGRKRTRSGVRMAGKDNCTQRVPGRFR